MLASENHHLRLKLHQRGAELLEERQKTQVIQQQLVALKELSTAAQRQLHEVNTQGQLQTAPAGRLPQQSDRMVLREQLEASYVETQQQLRALRQENSSLVHGHMRELREWCEKCAGHSAACSSAHGSVNSQGHF